MTVAVPVHKTKRQDLKSYEQSTVSTESTEHCPTSTDDPPVFSFDPPSDTLIYSSLFPIKKEKDSNKRKSGTNKQTLPAQNEMAQRLASDLADRLAWDESHDEWLMRDGEIWSRCTPRGAAKRIMAAIENHAPKYSNGYLSGVTSMLQTKLHAPDWTDSRELLPLLNGVLNLRTGATEPYSAAHRFNWQLPYNYDATATCPVIDDALMLMCGNDAEMYRFLLAWMYCVLTGQYQIQKYLEVVGQGGTGKSTFLAICTMLVGEKNRITTDLHSLENNRFESSTLYGKRLAVISDSQQHRGEMSVLKQITGGDPVRHEVKNKPQLQPFIYTGLVMIATNEAIRSSDYSSGLTRRRTPLIFNHEIPEDVRARFPGPDDFNNALQAEMPGLINKLLALDHAETISTIRNPTGVVAADQLAITLESNPVLAWADEYLIRCEQDDETIVGRKQDDHTERLYPSYCRYCDNEGQGSVANRKFSSSLEQLLKGAGVSTERAKTKSNSTMLRGLRLRTIHDDDTPTLLTEHTTRYEYQP